MPVPQPKRWRTDAIEPTYTTGEVCGWTIDGRIEIEDPTLVPVVAWADLPGLKRPAIATCHMHEHDTSGVLRAWILTPRTDGRVTAELRDPVYNRHVFDRSEYPGPDVADPVLRALYETAVARVSASREADRQRRAGDPLIDRLDRIMELAAEVAIGGTPRAELDSLVAGLPRPEINEMFVRLALDNINLADRIDELQDPFPG